MRVAIVHDYLTQRGGAERVVLSMTRAFPDAPVYTSLFQPHSTFPEFGDVDVRTSPLNRLAIFRRDHRRALPFLAPTFSAMRVDADVTLCSSSGWAHGCKASGRKIVYCHNPARWLYQADDYLGEDPNPAVEAMLRALRRPLLAWDRRAAATADRYLTQSSVVRQRIEDAYGVAAVLLAAPAGVDPTAATRPVPGVDPGFYLCVSRLQRYKHVDAVVAAFEGRPHRLVVVGNGPDREAVEAVRPPNVTLLGGVADDELRWLYQHCRAVVSASKEDYGLTPLEARMYAKPAAVLRFGGFFDTVVEGETGVFFDRPEPRGIAEAIDRLDGISWSESRLREAAAPYREEVFVDRLRDAVDQLSRD